MAIFAINTDVHFFQENPLLFTLFLFIGSFTCVYIILPKIRSLARVSNFISKPSLRSSHQEKVPNIGGLSFFVTIIMFYFFIHKLDNLDIFPSLLPGLTILFIIGLKDDLVMVNPSTKIFAQIFSSFFFVFHNSFAFFNFRGFLWIHEFNPLIGVFLSIFLTVLLINAFNLLDGIDGFAAIIGIIIFLFYFIFYYYLKFYFLALINVILLGSLFAFLRYNLSNSKKIFMGDTGSMIIGFFVSVMTIHALSLSNQTVQFFNFPPKNLPFVLFSVLFLPLFDTFRVMVIRLVNKVNPFEADRRHIHHVILDYLKCSHLVASIILGFINIIIIVIFFFLANHVDQTIYFGLSLLLICLGFFCLKKMSVNNALEK